MLQLFMANGTYLRADVNFCCWVWVHTRQCSGLTLSSMLRLPPGCTQCSLLTVLRGPYGRPEIKPGLVRCESHYAVILAPRENEKGALRWSSEEMTGAERRLSQEGLSTPPPRCQLLTLTRWPPLAQVLPQAPRDCLLGSANGNQELNGWVWEASLENLTLGDTSSSHTVPSHTD